MAMLKSLAPRIQTLRKAQIGRISVRLRVTENVSVSIINKISVKH